MKISTNSFSVSTKGFTDIIDITNQVQNEVNSSEISEGNVLVFVPGATAGITTIEFEPGLLKDYPEFMEKLVPSNKNYHHDMTWHDGNGFSHLRASLQGASFQVPFKDKNLLLGTWQQIILVDFDNRSRNRKVIVQIMGI
ncbi:MAG: secondary thiamine-phosphate synthase enzyme YjbQ [Ignavibacteriae bacterium]|nr:secondary thiamine-phosphate synthase enzyme YjbQ [Ignavibacteriota bacterium]MCB9219592.1 YjbQ family protein [Ignavibacteriales bacterium]MCB9257806.1 YjbQ family protein [Ignavibacteriales bacterium]